MGFEWEYRVRFGDTDGAGVVYFARFLEICHGAYEASLAASGIDISLFFSGQWNPFFNSQEDRPSSPAIAVPIVATEGNFYRPCGCGDLLTVQVRAQQLKDSEFEVKYDWYLGSDSPPSTPLSPAGTAMTRHVCIQVRHENTSGRSRRRYPLPPELRQWLAFVESAPEP